MCTGSPKNPATPVEFQSILTRLKLNIFERFKNQKNLTELWDFEVVLGLRFFWDIEYLLTNLVHKQI